MFTIITMIAYGLIVMGMLKIGFMVGVLGCVLGVFYAQKRDLTQLLYLQLFFMVANVVGLVRVI